jgi:uncharacterized protein YukE
MPKSLLLMLMLLGFAITVHAQEDQLVQSGNKEVKKSFLYQWTDKKGIVHIADGLDKVPKEYRDKAIKLKQTEKEEADQGQEAQQPSVYPSGAQSEAADAATRAAWQQRMKDARQRLAGAERRYQELEKRRDELLQSWGGPASGRLAERAEADKVEQQMRDVQKEMDEARNDIDIVIPEDARKMGIPPGWLRE